MDGKKRDGRERWFPVTPALILALCLGSLAASAFAQDESAATPPAPTAPQTGETTEPAAPQAPAETTEDAAATEVDPDAPGEPQPEEPASAVDALIEVLDVDVLTVNPWWRWLILLGAIFLGLLIGKIAQTILRRVGEGLETRGWHARGELFTDAASPAKLLIFTLALSSGLAQLEMGSSLRAVVIKTMQLLIFVAIFWYAFNLISIIDLVLRRKTEKENAKLNEQFVSVIRKTLRIFLIVIAVLFIAQNIFEQDIGAWLAGLGIAGLAVSLAAQDSLKNLFGSITILMDRPYQVGERINYGGYDGIVEDIGFRSTKMRTLTGHLVNIPNSRIVNDPVENIAQRPTIRRIMNITITYDTPVEKVRQAVQILRDILEEEGIREPINPVINGDTLSPRVHFNELNADSLNIFLIYWYGPPVWWDYLEHSERLNFRIFEAFNEAGIDFAFPTQTIHLANDDNRQLAVRMLESTQPA